MEVYLHLMASVSGGNDILSNTGVNMLRYHSGHGSYHVVNQPEKPFLLSDLNDRFLLNVEGYGWEHYHYRNIIAVRSHNHDHFNFGVSTLRILNLGQQTLEVFGIGVEVRQGPAS